MFSARAERRRTVKINALHLRCGNGEKLERDLMRTVNVFLKRVEFWRRFLDSDTGARKCSQSLDYGVAFKTTSNRSNFHFIRCTDGTTIRDRLRPEQQNCK